jgi:putative oxidoreductase
MHRDLGLLILRASAGVFMAFGHGLGKLQAVLAGNLGFADPLGIGEAPSKLLVVFAEFFCALAVALGFKVRWTAVPVAITMLVAGLVRHGPDPWGKKELALVYAAVFIAFVFTGGGRYAVDSLWRKRT